MHLYNVEDWKKHTEGKHHMVNMSREGSQQQDVTRKSGTWAKYASNHPSKFCEICQVSVYVIDWDSHTRGKTHNIKRKNNITASIIKDSGIFISGVDSSVTEEALLAYFKTFGKIEGIVYHGNSDKALVQFDSKYPAAKVLKNKEHRVCGRNLLVTPRNDDTQDCGFVMNAVDGGSLTMEKLGELLNSTSCSSEDQIGLLSARLMMNNQDTLYRICGGLEKWLSFNFQGCQLIPFGSAVSGLAFRESDIDVFLRLKPDLDSTAKSADLKADERKSLKKTVEMVTRSLKRHPDLTKVFCVVHARIPLCKFQHKPSGLKIDLSLNNDIAVCNSQLIRHLQTLDKRVTPYLFLLKYWAKLHKIIGEARDSSLSSYAFTMMALLYLQTIDPPILPSIDTLKRRVPNEQRVYYDGWNSSFCRSPVDFGAVTNGATVVQLLNGFFSYYSKLNTQDIVLSPLIGSVVPWSLFERENVVFPEALQTYADCLKAGKEALKKSELCVQDPFELNFNVTHSYRRPISFLKDKCHIAEQISSQMISGSLPDRIDLLFAFHDSAPKEENLSGSHSEKSKRAAKCPRIAPPLDGQHPGTDSGSQASNRSLAVSASEQTTGTPKTATSSPATVQETCSESNPALSLAAQESILERPADSPIASETPRTDDVQHRKVLDETSEISAPTSVTLEIVLERSTDSSGAMETCMSLITEAISDFFTSQNARAECKRMKLDPIEQVADDPEKMDVEIGVDHFPASESTSINDCMNLRDNFTIPIYFWKDCSNDTSISSEINVSLLDREAAEGSARLAACKRSIRDCQEYLVCQLQWRVEMDKYRLSMAVQHKGSGRGDFQMSPFVDDAKRHMRRIVAAILLQRQIPFTVCI